MKLEDINAVIPPKYQPFAVLIIAALPYATRAAHALYYGRGILGAIKGILFGTNTPALPVQYSDAVQARHDVESTKLTGDPTTGTK
jgi:hypothetical protein